MSTDAELRISGLRALVEALGPVDAERFITLMLREPFDYTRWRQQLWSDKTVEELSEAAMQLRRDSRNHGGTETVR
jgi:hypothetical protein